METLDIKSPETTSGETHANLERVRARYGFVPNLIGAFANSPLALEAYLQLERHWEHSSFTVEEQNIILLTASVENTCPYCTAGYSTALKRLHVPKNTIQTINSKEPLEDYKLNSLIGLVREIVEFRGFPSETSVENFFNAGYQKTQLIELLMGISLETMSNYLDHILTIPIDEQYKNL